MRSGVVTRKSLPRLPSRPTDTLQPNTKQTCCRERSPEGARTINLLSAAAGRPHRAEKRRRTHSILGFTASLLLSHRGEKVTKDIELCCRLEQLRIPCRTSTGPLQNRQRNRYAGSFSNSYFQADVGLKVEIQVELAKLLGSCPRHQTLPALKRH